MADEKLTYGGLADRLKGIVSVYKICKELNLNFKINFTYPFELHEYLIPNVYDWKISRNEIYYNKKYSKPCFIPYRYGFFARRFFAGNYKQIHIYTNMSTVEKEFSILFYELFKIHPFLQTQINTNINLIGCVYISVAFRFLQLLG
ncbi:MAG: hypothetical protein LBC53_02745, partial [Spirochaetaceae bacterium]|nr:hypothetical protein [Spirochaetaceae bacterium]